MTISSSTAKSGPFAGNGATKVFALGFACFAPGDLSVIRTDPSGVDTPLVFTTDYTVNLNADQTNSPGGTITTTAAPATGYQITILRNVQLTQGSSLPNQGGWYPNVIEKALDKLTMIVQQLQEKLSRSITLGVTQADPTALINTIATNAANAAASATSAAGSATSAATSASSSATSSTAASNSASAAATSATNAASSAAAAAASAASVAPLGDHEVVVVTGNGLASTNTTIRRFTTIQSNVGTAITYADSATLGASFTINETGIYHISYTDWVNTYVGISVNSNQLNIAIQLINASNRLAIIQPGSISNCSIAVKLSAGDVIRPHVAGGGSYTEGVWNIFRIRKVGK